MVGLPPWLVTRPGGVYAHILISGEGARGLHDCTVEMSTISQHVSPPGPITMRRILRGKHAIVVFCLDLQKAVSKWCEAAHLASIVYSESVDDQHQPTFPYMTLHHGMAGGDDQREDEARRREPQCHIT